MNLKTDHLSGVKSRLLLMLMLVALMFGACKKTTTFSAPANVGTIRFNSSAYTIDLNAAQPLNILLPLSLPLESDATVILSIDSKSTALSNQYTVDPVIPAGGLTLTLPKGSTQYAINVTSLNNFEGDATLIFKLTSPTGGVTVANVNATTTVTIHGKPVVLPALTASVSSLDFGPVNVTTTSPSKSFTVSGVKLTSNVSVASADNNYKVSLNNTTFSSSVTITAAAAMAAPVTVYTVFAPNTNVNQTVTGSLTITSGVIPGVTMALSGVEAGNASAGVLLIKDDFNYGAASAALTTASNSTWAAYSAAGANAVQYTGSGLSLAGYIGSGIGGAAISENKTASAEDVNLLFTSQSSGTIYVAQLLNFISAPTTADFFTSLGDAPASPTFHNRIYAKANGTQYQLGLSRNSTTTPVYSGNLDYGTTYLVVTKYDFSTGTGVSSMYVLTANIPTIEPTTPDVTSTGGADAAAIAKVIIRQSTALPLKTNYDGVRVATSWRQAVGK